MALNHIRSAVNLRSLCGLRTLDGKVFKERLVWRTAALYNLSAEEAHNLHSTVPLSLYLDLRTAEEIARDGKPEFLISKGMIYEHHPVDPNSIFDNKFPEEKHWISLYERMFDANRETFRAVIHRVATVEGPVIFGCSAGKDRTGITACLILSLLGVPRDVIIADYALTTERLVPHLDSRFGRYWRERPHERTQFVESFFVARPGILAGFLAHVDRTYGSVQHALWDADGALTAALRARLLQDAPPS